MNTRACVRTYLEHMVGLFELVVLGNRISWLEYGPSQAGKVHVLESRHNVLDIEHMFKS